MKAERLSEGNEQTSTTSDVLFGLHTKDRPVDDESYPTVWLMTDEEYQQLQDIGRGGELL